ncbi:hypothetical protein EDD86DRAFT_205258 [Gorgonomyces haynaldii]|nr:hypothetical protein EDD86DRAFT_205258 [Gorgonomyces haynaldii]
MAMLADLIDKRMLFYIGSVAACLALFQMTSQLPPNLLRLFAPRPPVKHIPAIDKEFKERRTPQYTPVALFLEQLGDHDKDYVPTKTLDEQRKEKKELARIRNEEKIKELAAKWDPANNPELKSDPYKTLFVSNLHYETTDKRLHREFEKYGPIHSIVIVQDTAKQRPRGYAFVEFENEADMKRAFKESDGALIDNRKILVDVERGRTVTGWKPRSLGGGLGDKRTIKIVKQIRHDARVTKSSLGGISKTARPMRNRQDRPRDRPRPNGTDRKDGRFEKKEFDRRDSGRRDSDRRDPERRDRPEPGQRFDRPEPGQRFDRSDRGERFDRGDRFDRDRPERGERFERPDRGERFDRDRPDRGERFDRDRPDHGERFDKGERFDRDRPDRREPDRRDSRRDYRSRSPPRRRF